MKVKLTKLFHPNISKLTTENGGRGTHFAKFLISLFQWGLTHSALVTGKGGGKDKDGTCRQTLAGTLLHFGTATCEVKVMNIRNNCGLSYFGSETAPVHPPSCKEGGPPVKIDDN